jgi:Na+(H+)/acetate symporter ActP
MRSKLADAARRRLNEDVSRMTAEERLAAFLAHCQLIAQLAGTGASVRRQPRNTVPRNAR